MAALAVTIASMIRAATVEDIPVIAELIRALAEYERLSHEAIFTDDELRETLFGERCYAEVLLVEHDGDVAGFALYFHNFSTFLAKPGIYLEDLFVRPEHRGHGHGKLLLAELARIAVDRGCGRLEWSVLDWNEPSIAFYRSLGAEPMDDWTVFRLTGDPLKQLSASGS
jgi:GNAT superfamily N-acetyltransferase